MYSVRVKRKRESKVHTYRISVSYACSEHVSVPFSRADVAVFFAIWRARGTWRARVLCGDLRRLRARVPGVCRCQRAAALPGKVRGLFYWAVGERLVIFSPTAIG